MLSGNLSAALRRAGEIVTGKKRMVTALLGALTYPLFLLGLIGLMMHLVCEKFIPKLAGLVPREKWTGALNYLTLLSEFVVDFKWLLLIVGLAVLWLVILVNGELG